MICHCTHSRPSYLSLESIVSLPKKCLQQLNAIWSGLPHSTEGLDRKATHWNPKALVDEILNKNNTAGLDQKLTELTNQALQNANTDCLKEVIDALSKESLEEVTQSTAARTAIKIDCFASAQLSSLEDGLYTKFLRFFGYALNFLPNLMNTLLSALQLFDTGKDPKTFWEISAALDILYKFVMIPGAVILVVHLLFPGIGIAAYAITGTIVLALIIAFTLYAKWLKPCPRHLEKCTNLTWEAKIGNLNSVVGRETEINALISSFTANRHSTVPILVGKSGVGKNEIVNALAQRIATENVPEELKGMSIFHLNAGLFNDIGGFNDPLANMMQRIIGHEDKVIFFIDEAHAAFSKEGLKDCLKNFFDKYHCIAATTPDEYEKIEEDPSLAGRLNKIDVSPIDTQKTRQILTQIIKDHPIPLNVAEEVLQECSKEQEGDEKRSQPASGKAELQARLYNKYVELNDDYIPDALNKLYTERKTKNEAYCFGRNSDDLTSIAELEDQIQQEEEKLDRRRKSIKVYKETLLHRKHHLLSLSVIAKKIKTTTEEKAKESLTKLFLFEEHYLLNAINRSLEQQEKTIEEQLGFSPNIK